MSRVGQNAPLVSSRARSLHPKPTGFFHTSSFSSPWLDSCSCRTCRSLGSMRTQGGYMRNRFRNVTALGVIAIVVALASALNAAPPARSVRVAVLTPGLTFGEILAGLRGGLGQLGYREGSNLILLLEDTKGVGPGVRAEGQALIAAKAVARGTIGTSHNLTGTG